MTEQEFINKGIELKVLPLFTKGCLAKRWGVSRQLVHYWSTQQSGFCQPIENVMSREGDFKGGGPVYPFHEVERYEKLRGLKR